MSTDAPRCKPDQRQTYAGAVGETLALACEVDAAPAKVTFEWALKRFAGEPSMPGDTDLVFTTKGVASNLLVTPKSRVDFATYSCRARNAVGWQREPCFFTLSPTGKKRK